MAVPKGPMKLRSKLVLQWIGDGFFDINSFTCSLRKRNLSFLLSLHPVLAVCCVCWGFAFEYFGEGFIEWAWICRRSNSAWCWVAAKTFFREFCLVCLVSWGNMDQWWSSPAKRFDTAGSLASMGFLQVWCVAPLLFDQSFLPSKRQCLKPVKPCWHVDGDVLVPYTMDSLWCQVQEQFLGDLLILRAAKPIAAGEAGLVFQWNPVMEIQWIWKSCLLIHWMNFHWISIDFPLNFPLISHWLNRWTHWISHWFPIGWTVEPIEFPLIFHWLNPSISIWEISPLGFPIPLNPSNGTQQRNNVSTSGSRSCWCRMCRPSSFWAQDVSGLTVVGGMLELWSCSKAVKLKHTPGIYSLTLISYPWIFWICFQKNVSIKQLKLFMRPRHIRRQHLSATFQFSCTSVPIPLWNLLLMVQKFCTTWDV